MLQINHANPLSSGKQKEVISADFDVKACQLGKFWFTKMCVQITWHMDRGY